MRLLNAFAFYKTYPWSVSYLRPCHTKHYVCIFHVGISSYNRDIHYACFKDSSCVDVCRCLSRFQLTRLWFCVVETFWLVENNAVNVYFVYIRCLDANLVVALVCDFCEMPMQILWLSKTIPRMSNIRLTHVPSMDNFHIVFRAHIQR